MSTTRQTPLMAVSNEPCIWAASKIAPVMSTVSNPKTVRPLPET